MRVASKLILPTLAVVILGSCGGGGSDGGPDPVLEVVKWTPSGDNQTDTVGQTLPNVIRVKTTLDGALAAGITVNFTGGNVGTASMVTGTNGIATTTWTLSGLAGSQSVTATVPGAVGSPLVFLATAIPDVPAELQLISGDSQVAEVTALFGAHMVVRVVDQFGNGKVGRWVYWSKTGPVVLVSDSIITGDQGFSNQIVTAGASTGPVVVTATTPGLAGSPLGFTASVVGATITVTVGSNFYTDSIISISAGSAVRWNWIGGSHSVTSNGSTSFTGSAIQAAPFVLGPLVFSTPGTYAYHCAVHAGMTGKVIVN